MDGDYSPSLNIYCVFERSSDNIMIVTSKRCYLNILTQLCNLDTLINANYFMLDVRSPNGVVEMGSSIHYGVDGKLEVSQNVSTANSCYNTYNITYGKDELNPMPFMVHSVIGAEICADPMERFLNHLNNTDTFLAVYNALFRRELRGNKLQIIIISDEDIVINFADTICEYLARNFGADITFIDPQYRPNVKGKIQYVGDKVRAEKVIHDLRDVQLIMEFNSAITQLGYDESLNNLMVWLGTFDFNKIMHLYNLLFPNDPLPPGHYTIDHIKQIIIGRVSRSIPKRQSISNLFTSQRFLEELEKYEQEDDSDYDLRFNNF